MGPEEGGETDRRHEIPRFQQTVHGRHCRRAVSTDDCSAGDRCASAGRDARARNHDGEAGDGLGGRQAMIARERACGAEWKADKAAGKIEAGMKWPQYWSACDKRKKAEGM